MIRRKTNSMGDKTADITEALTDEHAKNGRKQKGRTVKRDTSVPDKPLDQDRDAMERNMRHEKKVGKALAPPRSGCNCHGYTFDKGTSQISEADVFKKILPDNYKQVENKKVRICDVVVYGVGNEVPDHSGLVVEVAADGTPAKIVSKWGPTGGVFIHAPEDYGSGKNKVDDWDVYRRKQEPEGLEHLRDAYDNAVKNRGTSSADAHEKARALCQTKNALSRRKWL